MRTRYVEATRRAVLLLALAAMLVSQPGCAVWHHWTTARHAAKQLAWVEMARPEQDLSAAVLRGDFRFVGVYREEPEVPSTGEEDVALVQAHGVRYLEGTAEKTYSAKHKRLNRAARKYASRYNKLLLAYLKHVKPAL